MAAAAGLTSQAEGGRWKVKRFISTLCTCTAAKASCWLPSRADAAHPPQTWRPCVPELHLSACVCTCANTRLVSAELDPLVTLHRALRFIAKAPAAGLWLCLFFFLMRFKYRFQFRHLSAAEI